MTRKAQPLTYTQRLMGGLDALEAAFAAVLDQSSVRNIDPNRHARNSGVAFFGYPTWGWAPSSPELERDRMALLPKLRDLEIRFRLLFASPTPDVSKRHDDAFKLLTGWLVRPGHNDHSVPATIEQAKQRLHAAVETLRSASQLLTVDEFGTRLVVDTNALLDCPDLAAYTDVLGKRYRAHVLPVVFGELDELKRGGRHEDIREAARRAERRLKALRHDGDPLDGVRVAGDVSAVFEVVEPRAEGLPSWLDLSVPDDRVAASALRIQSRHAGSAVYVATSDLNLQNKLAALRLPFVEPPPC